MIPKSVMMLVTAVELGDKELEAEALRTMKPNLEVEVIREDKVRYVAMDPEDVRIFGFALQPRIPVTVLVRVRWRYSWWPADEWKECEFSKMDFPEYPEGPFLS